MHAFPDRSIDHLYDANWMMMMVIMQAVTRFTSARTRMSHCACQPASTNCVICSGNRFRYPCSTWTRTGPFILWLATKLARLLRSPELAVCGGIVHNYFTWLFPSILRFHCVILMCSCLGLAHYNTTTCKWRVFGSERQEESISCHNGLDWWRGYIIVSCHNSKCL